MTPAELREAAKEAARNYQKAERELCDLLSAIDQCRLWHTWGFASLAHYAEEELDLTHRKALELIRVNTSLASLPALDRAFRKEGVSFSKVREATRVATPGTDADWARRVKESPYREVERAVFSDRRASTITLRLELSAEEYDRFERAVEAVRRRQGRRTELGACLDAMAVSLLCGDGEVRATKGRDDPEPGKNGVETDARRQGSRPSSYPSTGRSAPFTQVIYRCEECERATLQTKRGMAEVSQEGVRQAECDSVVLREGERARRTVPSQLARSIWQRAGGCCERCGQRSWLHLHHRVPVARGGKHAIGNLQLLCSTCHGAEHRGVAPAVLAKPQGAADHAEPPVQLSEPRVRWGSVPGMPYPRGYEEGRLDRLPFQRVSTLIPVRVWTAVKEEDRLGVSSGGRTSAGM